MTYRGSPVFPVEPNGREAPGERLSRAVTRLGALPGQYAFHDPVGVTSRARSVTWTMLDADAIDTARAFLTACRGRKNPFWLPTWLQDYRLAADAATGAGTLSIVDAGYTSRMYPLTHRRDLALITAGGASPVVSCVRVGSASDVGATETLTLTGGTVPVDCPAAHTMLSHLLFVRLAEDRQTVRYLTPTLAEWTFGVVELPSEVPA